MIASPDKEKKQMMCLLHVQMVKWTTVVAAAPAVIASCSADVGVLRRLSIPLIALLSVMPLAGCVDRELYKSVEGHTVRDLGVSPDGQHLLIAVSKIPEGNEKIPRDWWSLRLCEFETGKELKRIDLAASRVAYGPDGTAAVWLPERYGQQDLFPQEVFLCDPRKDGQPMPVGPPQSVVYDAAWLPDGRLVWAGEGGMRLWDPKTQKMVAQWGKGSVRGIAVSADGQRLVAYEGHEGHDLSSLHPWSSIQVWDLKNQKIIQELKGYNYNY
ncbi:MAG: hypothetical protein KJ749_01220, partial [Planctomycetes bacterium]|nr:hypothetical protein [Planctomycetota bacterium]